MTKLSERLPMQLSCEEGWKMDTVDLAHWLEELAESVERKENVLLWCQQQIFLLTKNMKDFDEKPPQEAEYEPQTYDEAIALIKGWKRSIIDDSVHWKKTFEGGSTVNMSVPITWEEVYWPELWKEINTGWLHLSGDNWLLGSLSTNFSDSTPGRVVCQSYLVYKGHTDWAERLSKIGMVNNAKR